MPFDLSHRKYCESLTFVGIVVVVVVVVVVATGTGRVHVFFFRGRHYIVAGPPLPPLFFSEDLVGENWLAVEKICSWVFGRYQGYRFRRKIGG